MLMKLEQCYGVQYLSLKHKNMELNQRKFIESLIKDGQYLFEKQREKISFETGVQEAESILNNIELYPHILFFGCIMQRRIKAGKAWLIPYKIGKKIGGFEFKKFLKLNKLSLKKIFLENKNLRPRIKNPEQIFYSAINDIHNKYQDDVSKIWAENLNSAVIVRRLLEFKGVGIKIATMTTNILARDFKIKMKDYSSIDISPDVQVRKCFIANGLLRKDVSNEEIIYFAKEIYPQYPGVLDLPAWKCGREIKSNRVK